MKYPYFENKARDDFNRARIIEFFKAILNFLNLDKHELLSLKDVRSIVKPSSETYKGMQSVPIALIVGSEGRYKDFNREFLPRKEHLRSRWERVDMAHYQDYILPPVKLYEVGGAYFVRDGNHRVSVARLQGIEFIDAEIIKLDSKIEITPGMTKEELREKVIEFERKEFFEETGLDKLRPDCCLDFTAVGRYDDIMTHILNHKYFINLDETEEISFETAMLSWYDTIYLPIIKVIRENNILARFKGRTEADLYVWIVRHWHELKLKYGQHYSLEKAAIDFSIRFGRDFWQKVKLFFANKFKKSSTTEE